MAYAQPKLIVSIKRATLTSEAFVRCSFAHANTRRSNARIRIEWRSGPSWSALVKRAVYCICCDCLSKRASNTVAFALSTTSANRYITNTAGDQNINQYAPSRCFRSFAQSFFALVQAYVCLCVCVPHSHSKFFTKLTSNQWKFIWVRTVEK